MSVRSYETVSTWEEIADLLPKWNRISHDAKPDETFWCWEGHRIHIDRYNHPAAEAKIILLHGVGGSGRLLSFVGVPLHRDGFEVIAPDLPLYGLTEPKPGSMISYADWIWLVNDLINFEHSRDPRPIFLFGLSAGGMLAYQVACLNQSVIGLMATCILDQRLQAVRDASARSRPLARLGTPILRLAAAIHGGITLPMKAVANMEAIANDKRWLSLLLKDSTSAGSTVTIKFILSLMDAVPSIEPEDFDRCPLLLVHPENDRWVSVELSRLFYDRLKCPKRLIMLENAGHLPVETPGLQQLEAAVVGFIRETLAERFLHG